MHWQKYKSGRFFAIILFWMLANFKAHAGAWVLPQGEAEIIAKQTYTNDISPTPFRESSYSQREIYGQFGIGYNSMLSFTSLTKRSAQLGPNGTGSKKEIEAIYAPRSTPLGLFPPRLDRLIAKLTGSPVRRYKANSFGVGYSILKLDGRPDNQEFLRTSVSLGDKLQFSRFGLLGHVTWADLTSNTEHISDARAVIAIEGSRYAFGYEFGFFDHRDREPVLEDLIFLETVIPRQQARLRLTVANKTIALSRFKSRTIGIWLRVPFTTPF